MKKLSLIIGVIFMSSFVFSAQTKEEAREKAISQIAQIKTGVILVRLSDKAPVIKALEDKGMHKRAKMVKMKQKKVNEEIVASFQYFSFCKVYFFFSSDSKSFKQKDYSKMKLYTSVDSMAYDVELDTNFFVADFGMLTNEKASTTKTEQPKKSGISKKKTYKGSKISTSMRCMYLRDSGFNQLSGPFPFYVRFYPSPVQSLTYKQVVDRMDKQLTEFYTKYYI